MITWKGRLNYSACSLVRNRLDLKPISIQGGQMNDLYEGKSKVYDHCRILHKDLARSEAYLEPH